MISCLALFSTSIADVLVTFHYNPSLSREANPLVAHLGFGAYGLVISNILIIAFLALTLFFYLRVPYSPQQLSYMNPWEFAGSSIYGKSTTRNEFLRAFLLCWPFPTNWREYFRFAAPTVVWGVIGARVSAVFSWFAIWGWKWSGYIRLREHTIIAGYPCLELIIGLIVAAVMFHYIIFSEFKTHQFQKGAQCT